MTICPCCGFKSTTPQRGNFHCTACGAQAVGEPLPRPEQELPSFGRSLLLAVIGALSILVFLTDTIISLVARSPISFGFWSWVAAGETAAWHLKWAMLPLTALVFFGSRRIYRSIKAAPAQFGGLRYARRGYFASAAVPLLVLILIGVTVPARLKHRDWGLEAQEKAYIARYDRAQDEYRQKFGTLPSDRNDLRRLPDPDGSLAEALNFLQNAEYTPNSELAAVPTKKPRPLRGGVILNASVNSPAEETLTGGISFTSYELRLPGPDKIANTEDDLIVGDGVTYSVSEWQRRNTLPATTQVRQR